MLREGLSRLLKWIIPVSSVIRQACQGLAGQAGQDGIQDMADWMTEQTGHCSCHVLRGLC